MKSDLPDLFPGFETRFVEANGITLFCRIGGSGPPLLLLHGYPQSHVIWHEIASILSAHFTLVMPDLPGYGMSSIPPVSGNHEAYSKRSMASVMREMMRVLGYRTFFAAGHDRGGRVGYRLALDHPDTIPRLAVLDILPTSDYWDRMNRVFGLKVYHWMFLAQPFPFPEKMIAAAPVRYLEHTLASWTAEKNLDCFAEGALEHTRAWFCEPDRISACCEDYRAGATIDYEHDIADRNAGNIIRAKMLALWGDKGIATSVDDPLAVWQAWCPHVEGHSLAAGHFLPEEAPKATGEILLDFFSS
ncbi:haloacetate dehalogenase [Labrenzia sp. EL_208]|nr:haloacetate dehalogenase [Labrenzia sp. EL_132]MBG6228482.1 haloacetate dehalogenase [Labrenzia sp. EL_208]